MPHRIPLLTLALLSLVGSSASAAITLQGHDSFSNSFFNVFVDLQDILVQGPPIIPGNPVHDLSDPTQPELTTDVNHMARFDFGMLGHNGETFSFLNLGGALSEHQHLIHHLQAVGSLDSFFDVFFDVSFQDDTGTHAPFSTQLIGGPPIFPPGSISVNFQLYEQFSAAAPFTVAISVLNANEPATFALAPTAAVPEPGSFTLLLGGLLAFACSRRLARRSKPRPVIAV